MTFRHTKYSEANKRRERVFHWIRKNAKKVFQLDPAKLAKAETNGWYMSVEDTERALNHPGSSTLACKLYAEYLLERRKGDFVLGEHYHNTQTLGKSQKHAGSSSTDSLHRKFHYLSFVNRKRADVKLAKSLHAKFEPDPVLILGNWTQAWPVTMSQFVARGGGRCQ
ncbi:hypothetical protein BX661DRAFT_211552 [Kickxella alabastrina]|uniref:uncharacterized protein n=1 Tax=Kickxella alabastrina TaxID=61397 RepID=UPI00221E9511|nr:uncharacterized protein BX661DRAFT_211552 [Kickxella alabastrina]KAI7835107.1 hypothetical protein BX661DRAFT_211552 [Kickxella alabastrina]